MVIAPRIILQIPVDSAADNQLPALTALVFLFTIQLAQEVLDKAELLQVADAKVMAAAADGTAEQEAEIAAAVEAEADTFFRLQQIRQ
jgi:hypothetical protein